MWLALLTNGAFALWARARTSEPGSASGAAPGSASSAAPGSAEVGVAPRIRGAVSGVRPAFEPMGIPEAQALLKGLVAVNRLQLREGARAISGALHSGELRYQRDTRGEQWRTIRDIWRARGGDCEDLAAAVAAELQEQGTDAQAVIYESGPGLFHCVVELPDGQRLDPSRTGGMGGAA